jgi:hypothetical protein
MWIVPGERAQSRSDWAGTVCDLVWTRRAFRVASPSDLIVGVAEKARVDLRHPRERPLLLV